MSALGWCLTGHHRQCPVTVETWHDKTITCTCNCHKEGRAI